MKLILEEADFVEVLGRQRVDAEFGKSADVILGAAEDEMERRVFKVLPSIIADRLQGMVPAGFVIDEVQLTVDLGGKPFGVGVSGKVAVKYKRSAPS